MKIETSSWGVEPVPERLRVLGMLDMQLLWTNLGVSLLVLVLPVFFDLSLRDSLLATLLGGLIGNAMLAMAGLIGADGRVPAMVLQRAPLGQRGSYVATALNVVQCIGWTVFEILVIATSSALLAEKAFGIEVTWLWKLVFTGLGAVLALMGPVSVTRRILRKYLIWVVLASIIYLTWWILDGANLQALWNNPGEHHGSFWLAVDLVIALTVSWAPLAADYTRFAKDRRAAFWGTGIGYLIPTLYQFGFGSILVLSTSLDPFGLKAHPELLLGAIAAGGIASALALLALTADETDEAFANMYSTAMSLQNLLPRVSQRALIIGVAVLSGAIALVINMRQYERFLLLIGAVFVPLLGVLVADWLSRGRKYTRADIFEGPAFRPGMIGAWLAGFLSYEWLFHSVPKEFRNDYGWWSDLFVALNPPDTQLPAALPSFLVSLGLAYLVCLVGSAARSRRAGQQADPASAPT